jgi:hypothetical protein
VENATNAIAPWAELSWINISYQLQRAILVNNKVLSGSKYMWQKN